MALLKLLDLKCIPCPLNVVKVKLALEKLSPNQELIIELDKGEPEEMVQKTLKEMEGKDFSQFKKKLTDVLIATICPIGKKIKQLNKDKVQLVSILREGIV